MKKAVVSIILIAVFIFAGAVAVSAAPMRNEWDCVRDRISPEILLFRRAIGTQVRVQMVMETLPYIHYIDENSYRYAAFQELNPDMPFDKVIALVNARVDIAPFNDIIIVCDPYCYKVLLNQNMSLPPGWAPDNLVDIGHGHRLQEEAAYMFLQMREAMIEEGLRVVVISTFRTLACQRYNFNNAAARWGRASAQRQFALPGHSEHNAGLAVDIMHRWHTEFMSDANFQNSREFAWLTENAHNFGFILRYPADYRHIHRFVFEPWHWRFVGIDAATTMFESGIGTLEEFYGRYHAHGVRQRHEKLAYANRLLEEIFG